MEMNQEKDEIVEASTQVMIRSKSPEVKVQKPLVPFPPMPMFNIESFLNDPKERKWNGPFQFVLMADTQFGLIEKFYMQKKNPQWDEEIRITKAALSQINQLTPRPRFLFICGDMLDERPDTETAQEIRKHQYADFIDVFQKYLNPEIKIVVCAGNHDLCDIPTPASVQIYHDQFGPDFFSFWVGGIKCTVLNSQYWKSPTTIPNEFTQHQQFLETISDPTAKHSIVFQHIPFFVSDPNEDDVDYLNIEKEFRFPIMDHLQNAGVKYIFCGHYHQNGGGTYKGIQEIVTSALCNPLGSDPEGFRLVQVHSNHVSSEFIGIENLRTHSGLKPTSEPEM